MENGRIFCLTLFLLGVTPSASADEPQAVTRTGWIEHFPSQPPSDLLPGKSGLLGALFGAVAPKLVDGAIDAAAASLKAAGEGKAVSSSAGAYVSFY